MAIDKAKWHSESVEEYGLPTQNAAHHIAFFLRWCIEHNLMSAEYQKMQMENYKAVKSGEISVIQYLAGFDNVFFSSMLTAEGGAFADFYFHLQNGQYLSDLEVTLQQSLASIYHIEYNEENYSKLKPIIDQRFFRWSERC